MRIGIVHRFDVDNVRALSGFPYYMLRALEKHVGEVVVLGPENSFRTVAIEKAGKVLNRVGYSTFGRRFSSDHNRVLSNRLAHTFAARIIQAQCDVVFAPVASGEIAFLSTEIPIVYFTDITWNSIVDYYPTISSFWGFSREEGERIEAAAIANASAVLCPSQWTEKSLVEHYKADPAKVHRIPFGANFEAEDIPSREAALQHSLNGEITLIWVGVDWHRKRGVIAYECLMELLKRGLKARLIVCGCVPPESFRHAEIEVIPYLDKGDPAQRKALSKLYLSANFLLFPTLAEAFGIVICEASAHGVATLVSDTGGVRGGVSEGENGFVLPADATGRDFAEKVIELTRDEVAYARLVKSSRMAYEERLNWDAWGRSVKPIFEQVVEDARLIHCSSSELIAQILNDSRKLLMCLREGNSLLSILIVNWNGKEFLDGCFSSIREKVSVPYEVIVVDNHSTDGSADLIEERYPWVKLIRSADNLGFAAGNNLAARHATGEYLLLLNNDTVLQTDLVDAISLLEDEGRIGAVGARMFGGRWSEEIVLRPFSNACAALVFFKHLARPDRDQTTANLGWRCVFFPVRLC